ncbi:PHP domain-containing protein [Brachybacterium phenoliresistens]|uniref:Metal-dependent phosphoesterase n=1 Tax=Brachybacterium phenoliresistens TaxID=396014 RepID=Z9JQL1_9MICO|nr:PHP domain-containing protein [Brachybacterium phenoliresistens]EWS80690.1 metal-dependent phosphoesterase [Brachybacterium phenoliresistens]
MGDEHTTGQGRPQTPRIDLHTHSTYSDGTSSVLELAQDAAAAGLDVIALTDHDSTAGWEDARRAARETGVTIVPGIEVSAEHHRLSVHVLALLVDPSAGTALDIELRRARDSRSRRARVMVERIGADHPIRWEDVLEQVAGEETTVGRPHIADALVSRGIVADRSAAFTELLAPSSPYYVPYYAPAPADAVRAIVAAGGVAVAAHPASGMREGAVPVDLLDSMVEAGLSAVEVDHREHDEVERDRLRAYARFRGLLTTGGSDYHGAGKPNRLGENLTAPDVLRALLARATSETEVFRP